MALASGFPFKQTSLQAAEPVDMLACCPLDFMDDYAGGVCLLDEPSVTGVQVLAPGSPQLADARCQHHHSLSCRVEADVKLRSGSKRSCEGFTSLQDEAEADDLSMVSGRGSQLLCRPSSVRSLSIKRVCSVASADAIDSHCLPYQQQSIMIPVPGSTDNLQQAGVDGPATSHKAAAGTAAPTAPLAVPCKRSSKTGSCASSHELGSLAAAAAGQEAASGAGPATRRLAPINTSAAPKGPRLRLGGKLLSPEEAQKHLQAVAAAAAAATAARPLSRAQSPTVTCAGRASPAGRISSSTSLSGGGPANSAGYSSGASGPGARPPPLPCKAAVLKCGSLCAAADAAAPPCPAAALAPAHQQQQQQVMMGSLPDNFIPTPEVVGTWHTLASTLDDDMCGASSKSCEASPAGCNSFTELLLGQDGSCAVPGSSTAPLMSIGAAGAAGAAMGASLTPPAGQTCAPSAFTVPSMQPWALPQQQERPGLLLQSAASNSNSSRLTASCPVHIPTPQWTSSALLSGSNGSNGSNGSSTLAASLAPQGSPPGRDSSLAHSDTVTGAELTELFGFLAPEQQQQQQQSSQGTVAFMGSSSIATSVSAAAAAPCAATSACWQPAFAPTAAGQAAAAAATDTACGTAVSTGFVPVVSEANALMGAAVLRQQLPPVQQVLPSSAVKGASRAAATRAKRHSKHAAGRGSKHVTAQQQQVQQVLLVTDGVQPVVLSQQELMALLQQNMANSFASGYLMAQQQSQPQQLPLQPQQQPQLLKPLATPGAFIMPPAAAAPAVDAGSAAPHLSSVTFGLSAAEAGVPACAALAAAPGEAAVSGSGLGLVTPASSSAAVGVVAPHGGVDDILPSLQELLTDCY